jgi:tRNA 2-(methylsulfanyl)-N6-isopentenyladenosine37 hydroxylase
MGVLMTGSHEPRDAPVDVEAAEPTRPSLLAAATPVAWFEAARERVPELLVDHANCEKKAASTAIALMFAYADDAALAHGLSRLAREELRHFEQVVALMRRLGISHQRQSPGRYGARLRAAVRRDGPARKLDLLLSGALIEARSSERFEGLVSVLPGALAKLYAGLEAAEARHTGQYLRWAASNDPAGELSARLAFLAAVEAELATSPDPTFRFHSGPPSA